MAARQLDAGPRHTPCLAGGSARRAAALVNYSRPLGFQPLREYFSLVLAERGISATAEQIMLTDSGTQAMDLLCRLFVQPGDTVLVDDPCYFNFLNIARAHRANIVSVPYTRAGPELAAFERVLSEHSPRLYLTSGTFHNPTGVKVSASVQHRVLKLAATHNVIIVEDDIFADFDAQPAARLAAFDGFERVIYVGSYSKTLSAAMRCGYIAARHEWIEKLVDLRLATSFGGNELAARVVHRLLLDGSYRRHMDACERGSRRLMREPPHACKAQALSLVRAALWVCSFGPNCQARWMPRK